jgi:hypothetical protein
MLTSFSPIRNKQHHHADAVYRTGSIPACPFTTSFLFGDSSPHPSCPFHQFSGPVTTAGISAAGRDGKVPAAVKGDGRKYISILFIFCYTGSEWQEIVHTEPGA